MKQSQQMSGSEKKPESSNDTENSKPIREWDDEVLDVSLATMRARKVKRKAGQ
jgi:hypothetical protein